jgi:hypothetical protein
MSVKPIRTKEDFFKLSNFFFAEHLKMLQHIVSKTKVKTEAGDELPVFAWVVLMLTLPEIGVCMCPILRSGDNDLYETKVKADGSIILDTPISYLTLNFEDTNTDGLIKRFHELHTPKPKQGTTAWMIEMYIPVNGSHVKITPR